MARHIVLVDGSGFIFRAYHALPPLTRRSDKLPVGAVSGFCNMLFKLRQEMFTDEPPSHFAVIFDAKGKSFRNDIYSDYKANRPPAPEDLVPQFPLTRSAVRAFGIASIEQTGFEADDLIATYAAQARAQNMDVTIISSDKDLMQLIDTHTVMIDTMKDKTIGADEVMEKFGVAPNRVIDVQALAGDSTDNVPGVPGIGIKTAAQLIDEYSDLDQLLERAHEIKQNKRRENLIEFADLARISRDLVTLMKDVPVEVPLEQLVFKPINPEDLISFLKAMEFTTLTNRVAKLGDLDIHAIEPDAELAASNDTSSQISNGLNQVSNGHHDEAGSADHVAARFLENVQQVPIDPTKYEIIRDENHLAQWVDEICELGYVALDTETNSLDAMQADLIGISLATAPGKAAYIPINHKSGMEDLLGGGRDENQLSLAQVQQHLAPICSSQAVLLIGQNIKYDCQIMARHGMPLQAIDDTMLLSYVLDGGKHNHGMDELSKIWLEHQPIAFKELVGSGKSQITFDYVDIETAARYAAEDADITLRLWMLLKPRLVAEKKVHVYETLERPLIQTITRMEHEGILVDPTVLKRLSGEFAIKMEAAAAKIYQLAGREFNIGSPKQLSEILFEELKLPGGKKTKTGAWSTGANVLDDLAAEGHELPKAILEWRGLAKLKSTYTDALPEFIHPKTRRIHTSYSMAATTTGRFASTDPNLQNIPIRTEDGRKIRTAFIAEENHKLISADYSQIELRVLAHIADITSLKQAFADGLDIHAMTASEMFNIPIEGMDPMIRRRAKAINFGIIYGISAFGLANQLSIGRSEAREYIDQYFKRFPGIKDYMDSTKEHVHQHGYVDTIFGRRCHYPNINTKNPNERAFFERAAINAPIQGSAADIIRRAMAQLETKISHKQLKARMLLQVHDELIFEVAEVENQHVMTEVCKVMENACKPELELSVPLKVEARAADNWQEAH